MTNYANKTDYDLFVKSTISELYILELAAISTIASFSAPYAPSPISEALSAAPKFLGVESQGLSATFVKYTSYVFSTFYSQLLKKHLFNGDQYMPMIADMAKFGLRSYLVDFYEENSLNLNKYTNEMALGAINGLLYKNLNLSKYEFTNTTLAKSIVIEGVKKHDQVALGMFIGSLKEFNKQYITDSFSDIINYAVDWVGGIDDLSDEL